MKFIDCKEHEITSKENWNFGYNNLKHTAEELQKYLKPGEFIEVDRLGRGTIANLENSVKKLRENRLNIGENNEQFGYEIFPRNNNPKMIKRLFVYRRRK